MTEVPELTPKQALELRLMLVMYRQGWRDAITALQIAGQPVEKDIKKWYQDLQPEKLGKSDEG